MQEIKKIRLQLKQLRIKKHGLRRSPRLKTNKFEALREIKTSDLNFDNEENDDDEFILDANTPTWNIESLSRKEAVAVIKSIADDTSLTGNFEEMELGTMIEEIIRIRDKLQLLSKMEIDANKIKQTINRDTSSSEPPQTNTIKKKSEMDDDSTKVNEAKAVISKKLIEDYKNDQMDEVMDDEETDNEEIEDEEMENADMDDGTVHESLKLEPTKKQNQKEMSQIDPSSRGEDHISFVKCNQSKTTEKQGENKHPVFESEKSSQKSSDNKRGLSINSLNPITKTSNNVPPPRTQRREVPFIKNTSVMRVKIAIKSNSVHAPSWVKKVFQNIRNIDPTLTMIPFYNNNNANYIITSEKDIPNDIDNIKTWVTGIRISKQRKLEFSVKISHTTSFREIRNCIFNWCTSNKCWITFDEINCESIFMAGWLRGVHPHIYDREKIKQFILNSAPNLKDKIHVYFRSIWHYDPESKKRTMTEALVIDGDLFKRDEIMNSLYSIKWSQPYQYVNFIPFRLSASFQAKHQQRAMQLHNTYMNNIRSKIINIQNPDFYFNPTKKTTIIDWLKNRKQSHQNIFLYVEKISSESVKLVFLRNYENIVNHLIIHLFEEVKQSAGDNVAIHVLGPEIKHKQKLDIFNRETAFEVACATSLGSHPIQQHNIHKNKTPTITYGQIVSGFNLKQQNQTSKQNINIITQDDISIPDQPENQPNHQSMKKTDTYTESALADIEHKLEAKMKAHSYHLQSQVEEIEKKFRNQIKSTKDELTEIINNKETEIKSQMETILQYMKDKEKKAEIRSNINSQQHDQVMSAISALTLKAPSAVEYSCRGVKP